MPKHACTQEEQLKKISNEVFGNDADDKEGLKDRVKSIQSELKLRPTFKGILLSSVGLIGAAVTLLVFLFNFLLNNQAKTISAQIETAMANHTKQESQIWADRQKDIEEDVFTRVARLLGRK